MRNQKDIRHIVKNSKMEEGSFPLPVVTLNLNELNSQLKGRKWHNIKKKKIIQYILSIRNSFIMQNVNRLKVKGWKKLYANNNKKGAGVTVLISKLKLLYVEGHYQ